MRVGFAIAKYIFLADFYQLIVVAIAVIVVIVIVIVVVVVAAGCYGGKWWLAMVAMVLFGFWLFQGQKQPLDGFKSVWLKKMAVFPQFLEPEIL